MTIDITKLILAILGIIVELFTVYALPAFRRWLLAKVGDKNLMIIKEVVKAVVKAMEQTMGEGTGVLKKENAITVAIEILAGKGIMIDRAELDAYIEAAVLDLKHEIID